MLANRSGTLGFCGLQLSKGRIVIIDNEISEYMIVNRKYVIAHTNNIVLKKPSYKNNAEIRGIFG